MPSPPNHPPVTAWFARLDAAWRRMPAEERTRQREEIEQHLEGLVAAKIAQGQPLEDAWEAALVQFGDPTQIGRKMYGEWQQGRIGFRADMTAILFGVGLQAMRWVPDHWLNDNNPHPNQFILLLLGLPATALIGVCIGRKYPYQAIKGALFWPFLWPVGIWVVIAISYVTGRTQLMLGDSLPLMLFNLVVYDGPTIFLSLATAYLASVTKRGWYRPALADFKITPPRRRFKIAK